MTDKQIIKPRPICLYQDTCLFLKEKTRVCEDCVHHKNYWSELLARDQAEKIKSLEQECEELGLENYELNELFDRLKSENDELKKQACGLRPELKYIIDKTCSKYNINAKYYHEKIIEIINNLDKYKQTLTEIKEIAENGKRFAERWMITGEQKANVLTYANAILQKISEVEDEIAK